MTGRARLSLRNRLAALSALAVAVAVAVVAVASFLLVRSELIRQVDTELLAQSRNIERLPQDLTRHLRAEHDDLVPHPDPGARAGCRQRRIRATPPGTAAATTHRSGPCSARFYRHLA